MAGSLRLSGNQFHIAGSATEKAHRPQLLRWWRGTTRRPWLAEQRCCLEATLETDWQRSTRYLSAWLCRQLNSMRSSLNATRSGTGVTSVNTLYLTLHIFTTLSLSLQCSLIHTFIAPY